MMNMSSSSPTTTTTTTTTATMPKRRPPAIGPRALHLVESATTRSRSRSTTDSPTTPSDLPSPPTSARSVNGHHHRLAAPRRQSSISYKPPDSASSEHEPSRRSPLVPRHNHAQSLSFGSQHVHGSAHPTAVAVNVDSRETAPSAPERPPLTLAEKHAELLHFIAQKESKCLELRTQLTVHEAELLQLKRKWERIVSRRYGGTDENASNTPGSNVLEGIKEGVQGVSRFLVAGLGDFSSSPAPTATSPTTLLQKRHSAQPSISSDSMSGTCSTRFSQSSASSLGDDVSPSQESSQILIVHDTGATPTVSPNLAFVQQQRRDKSARRISSREISNSDSCEEPVSTHAPETTQPSSEDSMTRPTGAKFSDVNQKTKKNKVVTSHRTEFPPVPPIPGLGTLAAVSANVPPMSSWVGSVGRKWEELQRGSSLSKSQKRASVLLSDVSQSIVSAFSSPIQVTTAQSPVQKDVLSPKFSPSSSLLDDDDTLTGPIGSVLIPDASPTSTRVPPPATTIASAGSASSTGQQDDDEDWNW